MRKATSNNNEKFSLIFLTFKKRGILILTLSLVTLWSGCSSPDSGAEVKHGNPAMLTPSELRAQGWVPFEELSDDEKATLRKILGPDLEVLKGKKLLFKKADRPTTTPLRQGP